MNPMVISSDEDIAANAPASDMSGPFFSCFHATQILTLRGASMFLVVPYPATNSRAGVSGSITFCYF